MTFYQELQLNQAGSRKLIQETRGLRQKLYHSLVYAFKILLTLAFCVAFVTAYSMLFGNENSIAGVVVLLCVMVFRFADFGYYTPHALKALLLVFAILIVGPKAANMLDAFPGFLVNLGCIFLLLFLGCHNVPLSNHSTLVLGYLLLYGYDTTGTAAFRSRVGALLLGAALTGIVYYRNHRNKEYKRNGRSLKKEFRLSSSRSRWQLTMTLGVSSALFLGRCLNIPRAMWIAIAVMSVLLPFETDLKPRVRGRIWGNIAGILLFAILYALLPPSFSSLMGILGGIGVGLSVTYGFQSVFNSLGAIAAAIGILGLPGALFFRAFNNVLGALYGLAVLWIADKAWKYFSPQENPVSVS